MRGAGVGGGDARSSGGGASPVAGAGHEEEGRCGDYERRRGGSEGGLKS